MELLVYWSRSKGVEICSSCMLLLSSRKPAFLGIELVRLGLGQWLAIVLRIYQKTLQSQEHHCRNTMPYLFLRSNRASNQPIEPHKPWEALTQSLMVAT